MKKINVNCSVGKTGYGITSLNIIKELDKIHDLILSLFPISDSMELNSADEQNFIKKILNNAENFDYKAPTLKIWHQFDLASRIGSGKYFSFPFFEIDTLKNKERVHINSCDHIFVASKWGKQILENNGIHKPITVAPLAVDTNIFQTPPRIKVQKPNYVFCHIGKWEHRKAQDFLLQCFDNAFNIEDNVELRLLPHNPFLNKQEQDYWFGLVDQCKLKSKIRIFDRLPTQYHLAEFIYYCDCGVFLSRAEGWNNEILECMAMNKQIIATNYSAHTEYCNNSNAHLVDIDTLELANDRKWFFGEGRWAKLGQSQMEQTIFHMRNVYTNNIQSNPEGLKTANQYSWHNTANIIYNTIFNQGPTAYANPRKKKRRR